MEDLDSHTGAKQDVESRASGWPYPSPIDWEKYRPYLQEEIDTAGMAKDCVKLERLFQEVADLPDADELMTYVDRWGVHTNCIDEEE